jgi:hypothetical protein
VNSLATNHRRILEVGLAALAVFIWYSNAQRLAKAPMPTSVAEQWAIHRPDQAPYSYPWDSGELPQIHWKVNAEPATTTPAVSSTEAQKPAITLRGLSRLASSEAAFLEDTETGEIHLLQSGERWQGITLESIGRDRIWIRSADRRWELVLSSMGGTVP